jgi:alpha-beta hydrolase superfamily lysophospholipase
VRAWLRKRWKRLLALALAAPLLGINVIACLHARAMTHFTKGGVRTPRPDQLSLREKLGVLFTGVNLPRPVLTRTPTLPCTTERFAGDGVELEAWRLPAPGKRRGLVLLFHGYAASKSMLLPAAEVFHDLGYETYLVDFRGSGGSTGDVTTIGVREADDVMSAVKSAVAPASPGERPILFGNSMGAVAILRAIHARGLDPRAIILECPFDRLVHAVESRCRLMGVPAFPIGRLLVFWGGVLEGFDGFSHDPSVYATSVRCPSLLLQGETDRTITLDESRSIEDALGGKKTYKTFAGVGHGSLAALSPGEWREATAGFLASLDVR